MNFRASAEMLVLFPKRILAVYQDLTMPKRDWSQYDAPAVTRKRTWNHVKFEAIRHERRRLA